MNESSALSACRGFNALRLSRRNALKVGGMGLEGDRGQMEYRHIQLKELP